jgi:glutathione synthase/RimK-type ligase-like ATP-grasp enzyme
MNNYKNNDEKVSNYPINFFKNKKKPPIMTSINNHKKRNGRSCAFLSINSEGTGWCIYDDLLVEPLKKRGWTCDPRVNWHNWKSIPWSDLYDVVVIRSTWDYQDDLEEFQRALNHIRTHHELVADKKNQPVILLNDIEIVRWNSRKTYLSDLAEKANSVVNPSLFLHERKFYAHLLPSSLSSSTETAITREEFEIVVEKSFEIFPELLFKPIVGASSFGIARLTKEEFAQSRRQIQKSTSSSGQEEFDFTFKEDPEVVQLREGRLTNFGENISSLNKLVKRDENDKMLIHFRTKLDYVWCVLQVGKSDYIIQPFLKTISTQGEWSLFFFGTNNLSHAMRKIPRSGDFRVQEEYGAKHIRVPIQEDLVEKDGSAIIEAAKRTFSGLPENTNPILYARIDLIPIELDVVEKCVKSGWGVCFGKSSSWESLKELLPISKSIVANRDDVEQQEQQQKFVWSIMELELVEPSLYFDLCPDGLENFCIEFCKRFGEN